MSVWGLREGNNANNYMFSKNSSFFILHSSFFLCTFASAIAQMVELVDTRDLKSLGQ